MIIKYIVLLIHFSILACIGYFASKRVKNIKDYYAGGKKLGYWVVAFSSLATGQSAWLLLGLTGMGAIMGVKAFWAVFGEVLGVSLAWLFLSRKIKWFTNKYDSLTVPDYLSSRFKTKTHKLRILAALILTVFVTIYVSSQIDATGSAFESFFGWNYFIGAVVGFSIVVGYIFIGGFVAVAWSDLFHGLMMFFGLVLLPIVAFFSLTRFELAKNVFVGLKSIDPSLISLWGEGGFNMMNLMAAIGLAMIGIGFLGSPQIFVRFISIKGGGEIRKGTRVAILYTILTDSAAVFVGIFGRYMLTKAGQNPVEILGNGGQDVLPLLLDNVFPVAIVSLYIVAVLAAIMSTTDSLLIVASSAICRDVYQKIMRPDVKGELLTKYSRFVTLGIASLALVMSLVIAIVSPNRTIFWFVMFGWSGLAACFCPVIILSLLWKKYTEKGALASMLSAFIFFPLFKFAVPNIKLIGPYFEQLSNLPPSVFMAIVTGVVVSLAFPDKELEAEFIALNKEMEQDEDITEKRKEISLKEILPLRKADVSLQREKNESPGI